jgi:RNA-binding protein 23/39
LNILTIPIIDFYRETERDWDKELAEDVKGECEAKYGKVEAIKVERESQASTLLGFGC